MNHQMIAQAEKKSSRPSASGLLQRKCDRCHEKEKILQRLAVGSTPETVPPIVHEVLRSPGQALDAGTRAFMELRFGHDFSQVRVHTDTMAAESAKSLRANAYTVGHKMVFGREKYNPGTFYGNKLLAHELVHVIQQSEYLGSIQPGLDISKPSDLEESEARFVSSRIMSGSEDVFLQKAIKSPITIQRDIDFELYIKGDNYWFDNQGRARIAAVRRATSLGPGYGIQHDPTPAVGLPHYHILDPRGRKVVGHFFYGPSPPIKEREPSRYRERARGRDKDAEERAKSAIPKWLWAIIGGGVAALIIACFASGVCELGAIIYAAGAVAGALIIKILRSKGIRDSGKTSSEAEGGFKELTT